MNRTSPRNVSQVWITRRISDALLSEYYRWAQREPFHGRRTTQTLTHLRFTEIKGAASSGLFVRSKYCSLQAVDPISLILQFRRIDWFWDRKKKSAPDSFFFEKRNSSKFLRFSFLMRKIKSDKMALASALSTKQAMNESTACNANLFASRQGR